MNEKVNNWIIKADNDFKIAEKEILSSQPLTDIICFHCQQCVEKYLKAYLCKQNTEFRKTHNIAELLTLCKEIEPEFSQLDELEISQLTIYATELRYPEDFYIPSLEEAK
jgi:HEPN domain-containing protein